MCDVLGNSSASQTLISNVARLVPISGKAVEPTPPEPAKPANAGSPYARYHTLLLVTQALFKQRRWNGTMAGARQRRGPTSRISRRR